MRGIFTITIIIFSQFNISAQQVGHYFDSLKSVYHGNALFDKYRKYKKKTGLIRGLKQELESIQNETVSQVAVIAIFHNLYGYKWVEDEKLIKWIDSIIEKPLNTEIKTLAQDTKTYFVDGIIGQQLIPINLQNHEGDSISTDGFKGKYLIIDLWATWCAPCVQEMKRIPGIKKKYDNLEFYSISFDAEYWRMQ